MAKQLYAWRINHTGRLERVHNMQLPAKLKNAESVLSFMDYNPVDGLELYASGMTVKVFHVENKYALIQTIGQNEEIVFIDHFGDLNTYLSKIAETIWNIARVTKQPRAENGKDPVEQAKAVPTGDIQKKKGAKQNVQ